MGIFSKVFIALSLFSATTVMAIRPDDPDRNLLEGKSVDNLQRQKISIRTANLNDFRDQQIDGFSKQPQLSFNFTKSLLNRVNPKLKPFDSEMKIESIQKDKYGITHIRMQQYHKNIAVSGGQIIVHMNKDLAIIGVTGKWAPTMNINATPSLSSANAKAVIKSDTGFSFKQEPTLIYFDGRLAYECIIEGKKNGPVKDRYIVDAQSGDVLLKASLIKHAGPGNDGRHVQLNGESLTGEGSGTVDIMGWQNTNGNYFMYNKDSVWGVFNVNSSVNDWEQRATNSWGNSDPAAVSLGRNLALIQNCVMNVLGRKSFDDNNAFMKASVHEGDRYVNAYWDGESMYFGDGDGVMANALTVLDVVAHEYGHAITQYSSNLDYFYESGALNESFSDISGTIVEFLYQPDGKDSYPKGTPGHGDWLCGEDAWLDGDALRDLQNPNRFGQPSYYLGTNWYSGAEDNGGVHVNSGVQNFAFYLLTEGGSGTNDGHPYNITGLGLNQASEIAMYANMYLLTSTSQYRDSREAWMLAATILGYDTATVSAVWTAVGLPPLEKHLAVTPVEIHFGKIGVGVSDTQYVDLTNSGGSSTIISAINCSNPAFSVMHEAIPFKVPAQSTIRLPLVFTPVAHTTESGVVVIKSDAMGNATITLSLDGTGCDPAVMTVSPLVIKESLNNGDSVSKYVIIENSGEADLKIEVQTIIDKPSKTSIKTIAGKSKSKDSFVNKLKTGIGSQKTIPSTLTDKLSLSANATVLYYNTINGDSSAATKFVSELSKVEGLTIDVMNGENSIPTVEALMAYDVVITASNNVYANPELLGNNLASYVDQGGKVIILVASFSNYTGLSLEGKIADPEYMPLVKGEAGYDAQSPTFIDHPITAGIKNLICLIPIMTNEMTQSGASLGTYSSGTLVGAYNKNKPIVAINVFPFDDLWGGDLIPMIVNTIDWFGISNWLSVNPSRQKITVKASEACTLSVKMNATELFGGVYSGALHISNNDPKQDNPFIIPCTLAVRGISKFNVSPAKFNFDTMWTSSDSTILIKLSNQGTLSTTISSVTIDNPAFEIEKIFPMTLGPKQTVEVALTFKPTEAKVYNCTINFVNNAEIIENQVVSLTGVGVLSPIVTVTPVLIGATLAPQTTTTRTIRIRNTGGSSYKFTSGITGVTNGSDSTDESGTGQPWLSIGAVENVVPANSFLDIPVIFNSGLLESGEYSATISIKDIFGGSLGTYNVACNLTVKPSRLLTVTPLNVDFDTAWTNSCDTFDVDLHNQGSSAVEVKTIGVNGAAFSIGATLPMVIKPYSHDSIKVFFSPTKAGAANGQLTILSNATDNPKVTVKLTGTGFKAPKLKSTVNSLNKTLDPGSLKNITVKLSNSGDADYTYFARGKSSFTSIAQSFRSVAVENAPVYVLNGSYIYEIDPTSGRQTGNPIFVGDQRSKRNMLAFDGEYLYLASAGVPSVSVIDPVLRITIKTIPLPREVKNINNLGVTKSSLVFDSYKDSSGGSTVYIVDKTSNAIVFSWTSNKEIGSSFSVCGSGNDNTILMKNKSTIFEVEKVTGSVLRRIQGVANYESIDYSSSANLIIARRSSYLYYLNPENGVVLDSVVIGSGSAIDPSGDTLNFFMGDIASDEAGNVKTWVSTNSVTGTVEAHSNATFNISLDTRNMLPGLYIGYVDISYTGRNNADPLSIPCTLTVTSVGKCEIKPALIDFGSQTINKSSTVLVDIVNNGNVPTTVTTATIANKNFTVSLSEAMVIPPFSAVKLPITFSPKKVGPFKSQLKLTTNLVNAQTTAQLTGTGVPRTVVSTK